MKSLNRSIRFTVLSLCVGVGVASKPIEGQSYRAEMDIGNLWFDLGAYSNSATAGRSWALQLGRDAFRGWSPQIEVLYVKQGDWAPGLAAATIGARDLFLGDEASLGAFLSMGIGLSRVNAQNQENRLDKCTPETFCMFEGVAQHTGTYALGRTTLGLRLPISSHVGIATGASLDVLAGRRRSGDRTVGYSAGMVQISAGLLVRL